MTSRGGGKWGRGAWDVANKTLVDFCK